MFQSDDFIQDSWQHRHNGYRPIVRMSHWVINLKNKIFLRSPISNFLCQVQRYGDFKLIRFTCQASFHGKTEHVVFVKLKKTSKFAVVLICPVTSPYHLVPKHLRATLPWPEQFYFLREACSPNGTDNKQQCQTQSVLRPNPATYLRDFMLCMATNCAIIRKRCLN